MLSLCGSASSPLSGTELELVAAGPLARSSARAKSKSYLAPQSGRPEGGTSGRRQANTASQQDCGRAGGLWAGGALEGADMSQKELQDVRGVVLIALIRAYRA